ncbi:MAG: aminoglycoside phosphotransferase [Polaromonas sp.]|nr:aminoglycoside phosphotransferase [Polaromonas sp.]
MTASSLDWLDSARASAFADWLAAMAPQHGLDIASVRLASADASFRRYFRVDATSGPDSFIIMDAPPDQEDSAPFVKVAGLMLDAGLNAPRVLAWDAPQGFMLLNDLGAQTMLDVIAPPAGVLATAEPTQAHFGLYLQAVDVLVRWQLASRPDVLPPYDDALLSRELALFPDWYVGRHRDFAIDANLMGRLDPLFDQIKASNLNSLDGARVFVHRDFMPRNLMLDKNGEMGVLDFQDAVYGPVTYDIASLMRDAFLSWEEEFVLDITVRYWQKARKAGLPVGDDFGEFYRAVEWMGLQRHLKVLGIFARLSLRDGKPRYLADTPRFIKYARATCARYRQLGPLMVLLDEIEGNETRVGYTF